MLTVNLIEETNLAKQNRPGRLPLSDIVIVGGDIGTDLDEVEKYLTS
jgi:hypothetical protein